MFNKIVRYTSKIKKYGPQQSATILAQKIQEKITTQIWRYKACNNLAQHDWKTIAYKHQLDQSFDRFFESLRLRSLSFTHTLYAEQINKSELIKQADIFAQNGIDLLGSELQYFNQMPWHTDFRLQTQKPKTDCHFDPGIFYKDIVVDVGSNDFSRTTQKAALKKDIKVPWELSRFYHLFVLGQSYYKTGNKKYAQTFVSQITDWLDKNPYLLGVNWACPMEVAIRAVNWVVAFEFFKKSEHIPQLFWQRFMCSLYDHLVYLERNWEVYDGRTSNHYLANLLGYFYLCWFFEELPGFTTKRDWCYKQFLRECDKQIFDEGADYESSTYYHRLNTEIFFHFYLLCREFQLSLPKAFLEKLSRMFDFIDWCTPAGGDLVAVGDNDSGKILYYGLSRSYPATNSERTGSEAIQVQNMHYFPSFGLSVIKTNAWHITLRHHAYNNRQPSGHFHNDVGSITLAIDGIPIIVDPGSFVYTASVYWRNYFRSAQVHNTFFLADIEPVLLDNRLFTLDVPENKAKYEPDVHRDCITLKIEHDLYKRYGLRAHRTVRFYNAQKKLIIADTWISSNKKNHEQKSRWNFTLAPDITACKKNSTWFLYHNNKPVAKIASAQLHFELAKAWVSRAYGIKEQSTCLQAIRLIEPNDVITIEIVALSS